jgi:hypothetical protein
VAPCSITSGVLTTYFIPYLSLVKAKVIEIKRWREETPTPAVACACRVCLICLQDASRVTVGWPKLSQPPLSCLSFALL